MPLILSCTHVAHGYHHRPQMAEVPEAGGAAHTAAMAEADAALALAERDLGALNEKLAEEGMALASSAAENAATAAAAAADAAAAAVRSFASPEDSDLPAAKEARWSSAELSSCAAPCALRLFRSSSIVLTHEC